MAPSIQETISAMGVRTENIAVTASWYGSGDKIRQFVDAVSGAYNGNPARYAAPMRALGNRINADPGSMFNKSGFLGKLEAAGDRDPTLIRDAAQMFVRDPRGASRFISNWNGDAASARQLMARAATPAAAPAQPREPTTQRQTNPPAANTGRANHAEQRAGNGDGSHPAATRRENNTAHTPSERPAAATTGAAATANPSPATGPGTLVSPAPAEASGPMGQMQEILKGDMDPTKYSLLMGGLAGYLGEQYPDMAKTNQLDGFIGRANDPTTRNNFINAYNNPDGKLRTQIQGMMSDANMAQAGGGAMSSIMSMIGQSGRKDPKKVVADAMRGDIQIMLEHPEKMAEANFIEGMRNTGRQAIRNEYPLVGQLQDAANSFMGGVSELGEMIKYFLKAFTENFAITGNGGGDLMTRLTNSISGAFSSAQTMREADYYNKSTQHVNMDKDGKVTGRYQMDRDENGNIVRYELDDKGNRKAPETPAPQQPQQNVAANQGGAAAAQGTVLQPGAAVASGPTPPATAG